MSITIISVKNIWIVYSPLRMFGLKWWLRFSASLFDKIQHHSSKCICRQCVILQLCCSVSVKRVHCWHHEHLVRHRKWMFQWNLQILPTLCGSSFRFFASAFNSLEAHHGLNFKGSTSRAFYVIFNVTFFVIISTSLQCAPTMCE